MSDVIAGVDEVGRGPLAGPVIAAAVILPPDKSIAGLRDSKKCSAAKRERLFAEIMEHALAVGIGRAEVAEIDTLNILHASMLAMQRAVGELLVSPDKVLVDGNRCPDLPYECEAIVEGDDLVPAISAASIIAKVTRDREMAAYEATYPGYGFDRHSGYPTKQHLAALDGLGVTDIHRRSFAPVRERLAC